MCKSSPKAISLIWISLTPKRDIVKSRGWFADKGPRTEWIICFEIVGKKIIIDWTHNTRSRHAGNKSFKVLLNGIFNVYTQQKISRGDTWYGFTHPLKPQQ